MNTLFISNSKTQSGALIVLSLLLLSACGSAPRRDLKRYVPAVANQPLVPAQAQVSPTNLSTLSPTPSQPVAQDTPSNASEIKSQVIRDERSIFFDYDQESVKPEYDTILRAIVNEVNNTGINALRVEGGTDARGSREYNLALGQRRANNVKKSLTTLGIPANRISTISYGKEKLLATGDDEESHAINRRADVLYQGEY
jgi:peptidoglycan-associated lipoprotein